MAPASLVGALRRVTPVLPRGVRETTRPILIPRAVVREPCRPLRVARRSARAVAGM